MLAPVGCAGLDPAEAGEDMVGDGVVRFDFCFDDVELHLAHEALKREFVHKGIIKAVAE